MLPLIPRRATSLLNSISRIEFYSVLRVAVPDSVRTIMEESFGKKEGYKYLRLPSQKAASRIAKQLEDFVIKSDNEKTREEIETFLMVIDGFKKDSTISGIFFTNFPSGKEAGAYFTAAIAHLGGYNPIKPHLLPSGGITTVGSSFKDFVTEALAPHQDKGVISGASKLKIDLISLLGITLSGDRIHTYVIGADEIYEKLSKKTRQILSSPIFTTIDDDWDVIDPRKKRIYAPIFSIDSSGAMSLLFNREFGRFDESNPDCEFSKEEVECALEEFRHVTINLSESEEISRFCIEPNTSLIIRNKNFHGREGGVGDREILSQSYVVIGEELDEDNYISSPKTL